MDHDRQANGLCSLVNCCQRPETIAVGIGREQLMRRMNLQRPNADLHQPIDLGPSICHVARMHRAKRNEPSGRRGTIARNPVAHLRRIANNLRADRTNQPGALDSHLIKVFQKGNRIGGELFDLGEIIVAASGQLKHRRLEHAEWLDVDVNIDDGGHVGSGLNLRNRAHICLRTARRRASMSAEQGKISLFAEPLGTVRSSLTQQVEVWVEFLGHHTLVLRVVIADDIVPLR